MYANVLSIRLLGAISPFEEMVTVIDRHVKGLRNLK